VRHDDSPEIVALLADSKGWLAPHIIDVKTGQKAPWHGMQTAGYKDLVLDDDGVWKLMGEPYASWDILQRDEGLKRAILYLPGDGRFNFVPQTDRGDHYRFSSALSLLQWRIDNGLLSYTDEEQPNEERGTPIQAGGEPF
jgi:hypothetical protein